MKNVRWQLLFCFLLISFFIQAEEEDKILKEIETKSFKQLLAEEKLTRLNAKDVAKAKAVLWEKYKTEERADATRVKEVKEKKMHFNGATMRYAYEVKGKKPEKGRSLYIAMHGGGGAPEKLNESQYDHMKVYYKDSVKEGVYVAVRGVSNTWDLHFRPESYVLYDRLIENMILFEDVNPECVYIMGFSAGGDGVYRISTKMADRWAAAAMSAGHPGDIKAKNLYRVPFLLQVGVGDTAYKRHLTAAQFDGQLEALKKQYSDGFVHQTYLHVGRGHNFLDNHPKEPLQKVIKSPEKWLTENDMTSEYANTNSVAWLKQHTRNSLPKRVLWDVKNRCDRTGTTKDHAQLWTSQNRGRCHYWLQLDEKALGNTTELDVVLEKNTFTVNKVGESLILLLNEKMCDLSQDIKIIIGGKTLNVQAKPTLNNLLQSLSDRGDPQYMFEVKITLNKDDKGNWRASSN